MQSDIIRNKCTFFVQFENYYSYKFVFIMYALLLLHADAFYMVIYIFENK